MPEYGTSIDMWSAGCILGELLQTIEPGRVAHPLFPGGGSALSDSDAEEEDEEDAGAMEGDGALTSTPTDVCPAALGLHIATELQQRDYLLRRIFEKLGVPSMKALGAFPPQLRSRYRAVLQQLQGDDATPRRAHTKIRPLRALRELPAFRFADEISLDILDGFLRINPLVRLTAEQALRLPVFVRVNEHWVRRHGTSLEQEQGPEACKRKIMIDFEGCSEARIQGLLIEEIQRYDPLRPEGGETASNSGHVNSSVHPGEGE